MADEKLTNQNQGNEQQQGKAMGAAAHAGDQGQQTSEAKPSEQAGQGGGIQGSGQRQPNPGGFSGNEEQNRDERQGNQSSTQGRPDPTQGE